MDEYDPSIPQEVREEDQARFKGEFELVEEPGWDFWSVSRHGDEVWFSLSRDDGETSVLYFGPEHAVEVGIALAQAGQEPEEMSV